MKIKYCKSIASALLIIGWLFCLTGLQAKEADLRIDRKALKAELEKLDQSLKPLREKAYRKVEVIAARKKVDEAFREYYRVLRATMAQIDPEREKDIKRLIAIREQLHGKHSGSRAEDYEKSEH